MTATVATTPEVVVRHHYIRNTFLAFLGVAALALVGFGGYWVWTQQDSGVRMRAQLESAQTRIAELSDQLKGKGSSTTTVVTTPAAEAPANTVVTTPAAPAAESNTMTAEDEAKLNGLLLKKGVELLPPPNNGKVGVMMQTAKIDTPPSGRGCRKLVGTKHDDATHGIYQIWGPC